MTRFAQSNSEMERSSILSAASKEPRRADAAVVFVWSVMKRLAKAFSMQRRARVVAAIVPRRHWFRVAVLMSRWHARITCTFRRNRRGISEAYLREDWLIELSRLGPFPVPIRIHGAELLKPTASDHAGVVMCGTHVPLIMVVMRATILAGCKPELVVADPDNMALENGMLYPTGLREGVPTAHPGPAGLLRIKTILRKRGLVVSTLDGHAGGPSRPDLLVLAGRLGARVVIYRPELAPDGVVDVSFHNAVHPFCDSDEAIEANMQAIRQEERELLAQLDDLTDLDTSIAVLSQPDVSCELDKK